MERGTEVLDWAWFLLVVGRYLVAEREVGRLSILMKLRSFWGFYNHRVLRASNVLGFLG